MEESPVRQTGMKTPNGKDIQYRVLPTGLYQVEFSTGGQLPANLVGMFTSVEKLMSEVELYLAKRKSNARSKT